MLKVYEQGLWSKPANDLIWHFNYIDEAVKVDDYDSCDVCVSSGFENPINYKWYRDDVLQKYRQKGSTSSVWSMNA